MNIEEYKKYIQGMTKPALLEIANSINREQHADKYELLILEIKKRDSNISESSSISSNDTNVDSNIEHNSEEIPYAGFWKRFGAYWLDVIVLLPIMGLSLWGNEQSRLFQLYWFLPGLLIGLWFHVFLVKKYGGTPGKLLLNIKIAKVDGSDVGYREAILRYSVLFFITLLMSVALIPVLLEMTDTIYFSMSLTERALYMVERAPSWYKFTTTAMNIWIWSEFLVMLTNKKRRALHDFMAGTVVINKHALIMSGKQDTHVAEVTA